MKTIVEIVQHLKPGGIETMVLDLADMLGQNNRVFVISLEGNREEAIKAWPRLKPYQDRLFFMGKREGLDYRLFLRLASKLRGLDATAVHTHHIGPLIYGGVACRLAGIKKVVHTEHDAWHLDESSRRKLQRKMIRFVRPILVADAYSVQQSLSVHIPNTVTQVIKNGIDTGRFIPGNKQLARAHWDLPRGKYIVGCAGRLERVKGQDVLIRAMKNLPGCVHLVLAGSGTQKKKLTKLVAELGLQERVKFLGAIDDMPTFYQSLDVFCLPSHKEGMPLSPLEAQSCGVPAVVTDTGGSIETVCPRTGLCIPPNDSFEIALAIENILNRSLVTSPRRFVLREGSAQVMSKTYEQLLTSTPITV